MSWDMKSSSEVTTPLFGTATVSTSPTSIAWAACNLEKFAQMTPACSCTREPGQFSPNHQFERSPALDSVSRIPVQSEETRATTRLRELDRVEQAQHFDSTLDCRGGHYEHKAYRRAHQALTEANLAKWVAVQRQAEVELRLKTSQDVPVVDAVDEKIKLADRQLGGLSYHMNTRRLRSTSPLTDRHRRKRRRLDGSDSCVSSDSDSYDGSSDDMESGSGSSSGYSDVSHLSQRL
jgi:hypothetical protein